MVFANKIERARNIHKIVKNAPHFYTFGCLPSFCIYKHNKYKVSRSSRDKGYIYRNNS